MEDRDLWQAYAWPRRCLRANFVTTLDGRVAGTDGLSGSLSSPEDRRIFHMLRAGCDAILVGAGTARAEGYRAPSVKAEWHQLRGSQTPPVLVMVSRSGNVPDIEGALTVDGSDLAAITGEYPRVLCEGGPQLFTALLEQGLVDELALTVSHRLGGGHPLITTDFTGVAEQKHMHADEHALYTLWGIG